MNKAIALWMVTFLFIISGVMAADGCTSGQECTWYAYITYQPDFYNVSTINITIENASGDYIINNQAMTKLDTGKYSYDTILNDSGNYLGCAEYYNSTGKIYTNCESKEVRGDKMLINISILLIIIVIGFLFALFAEYSKNKSYYLFGTAWFFSMAAFAESVVQIFNPYLTKTIFIVLGFIFLIETYYQYKKNKNNDKNE